MSSEKTSNEMCRSGTGGDEVAPVSLIVAHAGFFQERRIGGEARDPVIFRHLHDLHLVGAVGEQLDPEVLQRDGHDCLVPVEGE
jgi:hypothetical protein